MSIFEEETAPQETPEAEGASNPKAEDKSFEDLLSQVKSDDGRQKYSSVEQAIQSIPHAQNHIKQLESDNASLKSQIQEKDQKIQELEQEIERLGTVDDLINKGSRNDQTPESLTEQDLYEKMEQYLSAKQMQEVAVSNARKVATALTEKFGSQDKAKELFASKAEELGLDVQGLSALAQKSPKAVLAYFGDAKPQPRVPDSSVSAERFDYNTPQKPARAMSGKSSDLLAAWRQIGQELKS